MDTEKNESQNSEIKISPEEFEKYKQERDEYLEGWKRAKADLINYKKEEGNRFEEFRKFSLSIFMKELLGVLDSFDLGLAMLKDDDPTKRGMILIRAKFFDILKKFGLLEIENAVGRTFNPDQHEAIAEVNSDQPAGTVVEEVEKGYALHGRLLRSAKVKVAKSQKDP